MEIPEIIMAFNGEKTIFSTNTAGNTKIPHAKKKKKMKLDFYSTQRQMDQTPQFKT